MSRGIVWFRRDLRLQDHPALERALQSHAALLLLYIDEGAGAGHDASRAWLRKSLAALAADIGRRGARLHVLAGDPAVLLPRLAAEIGASAVHVSSLHEPHSDARDERIAALLARDGVAMRRSRGRLLTDPELVRTRADAPYRVFTPFFRTALPTWRHRPLAAPARIAGIDLPGLAGAAAGGIEAIRPRWDRGFWQAWSPGEAGAAARLQALSERLDAYASQRDLPAIDATSRLSPHLHFGEISPGRVLEAVRAHGGPGADKFSAELGWREFAYYVAHHWPASLEANFNPRFDALPWREDAAGLEAWRRGRTGVPIVDAGMRQLWSEGWMHNRVRMLVASWLTKHMGIDWREGAAWFMHALVDADAACNALGWQWVAGTGVDAAPYFRIFNPVAQSRRFDPGGDYIRRWVPELRALGDADIHAPWAAPTRPAGYPAQPSVDIARGREQALARLRAIG